MAEIKISDLTPKGANLIATDLLVVSEDIGGGLYETKSITGDEVLNAVAKTAVAVRNTTGATIYKGTIVYISGTSGGKALISKAQANSEATSSKTLGVVTADIANNANGNVLTNGLLTLLDTRTTATHPFTTDTLVIGDDIYLSPTTAGYVTNVKPIAPNNLVNIGKVLETSATTGQILYAIVNGYELGELHDVDTTGATDGNILTLVGGIWKPTAISRGGGGVHALVKPKSGNSTTNMNSSSALGTLNVVTGRMYTAPFIPNTTITTSGLYINVTNPIASSLAKILIYDNLDGQPNTLLYESTDLDCSTSGIKTATTSFTFNAGTTYWFCFWGNNTIGMSSVAIAQHPLISFNGITGVTNYFQLVTYGAAPNPFGTTTNSNSAFPFIAAII